MDAKIFIYTQKLQIPALKLRACKGEWSKYFQNKKYFQNFAMEIYFKISSVMWYKASRYPPYLLVVLFYKWLRNESI